MCHGCGHPTLANSELIGHCVRYVATLTRIIVRGLVADHEVHLELSAFLVIVLYTYSNKRALKFSAVVSTIVSEATIYFLAMVAVQTFIQISMNVMEVRSLSRFPLRFVIAEPNASGSR